MHKKDSQSIHMVCESEEEGKDQELIQSSITSDLGHHMEK